MRPRTNLVAVFALLIMASSLAFAERRGQILVNRLQVRSSPGTKNAVVGRLDQGVIVSVVDKRGKWLKIRSETRTGWVYSKYVRAVPSTRTARSSGNRTAADVLARITAGVTNRRGSRGAVGALEGRPGGASSDADTLRNLQPAFRAKVSRVLLRLQRKGWHAYVAEGRTQGHQRRAVKAGYSKTRSGSKPAVTFDGAHPNGYRTSSRGAAQINRIVIHTIEGSARSARSWFKNSSAKVSAHYIVAKNGTIVQSVRDKDRAWHAKGASRDTIGIEHEGFSNKNQWTDAMLRSSARLTRWLCDTYRIPLDRQHIVGHDTIGTSDHYDPGRYFDWGYYMSLVRGGGGGGSPAISRGSGRKHRAGLAADIVDRRYGWGGPAANTNHPFWRDLGEAARIEGLGWGGFKDAAHVQQR